MESLFELLGNKLSGSALETMSQQLGADQKQTETAVAAAIPSLLEALTRQADSSGEQLHQAIERDHDGSLLENLGGYLTSSLGASRSTNGDGILGHLLGRKRESVESGVSQMSGLDVGKVSKLMAMLAPLVMGAVGKRSREQKMDRGKLTDFLRQERDSFQQAEPKQASIFGRMMDQDGDGDFDASDMMRLGTSMFGRMFKRQ